VTGIDNKPVTGLYLRYQKTCDGFKYMGKPVGGRGKKVPYSSVTVRVPEELKETVEALVDDYRQFILEGIETKKNDIPNIEEIKELSKHLLKGRTTRKDIIIKLVTSIYGVVLTDKDLIE
jgi:hypothetical protein